MHSFRFDKDFFSNGILLIYIVDEAGIVSKKAGTHGHCEPIEAGKRVLVLSAFMFPTDVLNALSHGGFKVVSSAMAENGTIVWTMAIH